MSQPLNDFGAHGLVYSQNSSHPLTMDDEDSATQGQEEPLGESPPPPPPPLDEEESVEEEDHYDVPKPLEEVSFLASCARVCVCVCVWARVLLFVEKNSPFGPRGCSGDMSLGNILLGGSHVPGAIHP